MLERVSPSAECAAQIFLRGLDAPVRSCRRLGPSFWRNGSDSINVPAWWPAYLDSIRRRSSSTHPSLELRASSVIPPTKRNNLLHLSRSTSRPSSNSTSFFSSASTQTIPDEVSTSPDSITINDAVNTSDGVGLPSDDLSETGAGKIKPTKRGVVKVWNEFLRDGPNVDSASSLLYSLAQSKHDVGLTRALSAFNLIPQHQRTAQDYQTVVDISIRLNQYSVATATIREAVSRNFNHESVVQFLMLCVSKGLWNTAADLWKNMNLKEFRLAVQEATSQKRNFAGRYAYHFDVIEDLPLTLVTIGDRLKNADPTLSTRRVALISLWTDLALLTMESEKIMRLITSKGVISLFALQRTLNPTPNLHFAALATINGLNDKGTRSELALLIYQNLKSTFVKPFVPKWIFGTLVAICSAARQPVEIYKSILNDYKELYQIPERRIYRAILIACADQGEVQAVSDVFNEFRKHHSPGDANDLTPLIRVHALSGNVEEARGQFERIHHEFGFTPSVRNWNALLLAYSRSNESERTYRTFEDLKSSRVKPDQYSWSIVVGAACKQGDTEYARKLIRQARGAGISPPMPMVGALVDAYLLNDKPDEAFLLVTEATKASEDARQSSVRLWNSLFRYYAFNSDSEGISQTQVQMREHGVEADSMTYAALMTALVVQRRTKSATQILRTLHFSQTLSVNEFHYSILIHGFVLEEKPHLALAMYQEMVERFPRASPSVKLSLLSLEAMKMEEEARLNYVPSKGYKKPDFQSTLDLINEIITDTKPSDLVSTFPNPGFGRKASHNDFQHVLVNSLVKFLQRNNAHGSANRILKALASTGTGSKYGAQNIRISWRTKLEQLSQRLRAVVHLKRWDEANALWGNIISLALDKCAPIGTASQKTSPNFVELSRSQNVQFAGNIGTQFRDMIPRSSSEKDQQVTHVEVLPAYRFILSQAISQYLRAISAQHKYSEMIETVQELHSYGFRLSGKNWNGFIQLLCKSTEFSHRMLAFELFEKHFVPNSPSWKVIRRGKWIHPSQEAPRFRRGKLIYKKDSRQSRKILEQLRPGLCMPTYYTMIHLAIVWLKASRASIQGDHAPRQSLESQTPRTLKFVLRTPYIRDRVQGVLLRGRTVIGDRISKKRKPQTAVNFAGIQGSKLLLDRLSTRELAELRNAINDTDPLAVDKVLETLQSSDSISKEAKFLLLPSDETGMLIDQSDLTPRQQKREQRLRHQILTELRQIFKSPTPLVGTPLRGQTPILGSGENMGIDQASEEQHKSEQLAAAMSQMSIENQGSKAASTEPSSKSSASSHQTLYLSNRIRRMLARISRRKLHGTITSTVGLQNTLIRTDSLTERLVARFVKRPSKGHSSTAQSGLVFDPPSDLQDENPVESAQDQKLRKRGRYVMVSTRQASTGVFRRRRVSEKFLGRMVRYWEAKSNLLKSQTTTIAEPSNRMKLHLAYAQRNARLAYKRLSAHEARKIKEEDQREVNWQGFLASS